MNIKKLRDLLDAMIAHEMGDKTVCFMHLERAGFEGPMEIRSAILHHDKFVVSDLGENELLDGLLDLERHGI